MMTKEILCIGWLLLTLILYLAYRRVYEYYMNKILQEIPVKYKLPSLRMVCITYLILSILTAFGGAMYYQQHKLPPMCEGGYAEYENILLLADEESYVETWQKYYAMRNEHEQINVSYRDIGDVAQLEFSQNEEGYVFLALRVKHVGNEGIYYRISMKTGASTTSTITKQNQNFIAMAGIVGIPEKHCTRHDITVRIYNVMEGENTNPIDIEETIEIDKVVNAR